jgi:adenine phosphoribosyltransferase
MRMRGAERVVRFEDFLRIVPDFPKPGILFRDISPLLKSPDAFRQAIESMAQSVQHMRVDAIVAIEARGFLFGAPLAFAMAVPLSIVRKPGKLPGETESVQYGLEYGADALHIQKGALAAGASVLVVDDVLATGGTAAATGDLARAQGAQVSGYLFLAELVALGGRQRLGSEQVVSLVQL